MGYYAPGMGFTSFVKKYLSIVLVIAALVALTGAFSGYATYMLSRQTMPEVTINETMCNENLASCITMISDCKYNLTDCEMAKETIAQLHNECRYDLDQLSLLVSELQDKVSAYEQSSTELQDQIEEYKDRIDELSSSLSSAEASVEELNTSVSDLESQLDDLQTEYDAIVDSAAASICCVQRVYNPELKYYYLFESDIVCTNEASEELGTKEFSC